MSGTSTIQRQHVSFAIAGVIFGFLIGFVVAHQVYGGRRGGVTMASAPETMGGQRGAPVMAPQAGAGSSGAQEGSNMAMMEQVAQELSALKKAVEQNPRDNVALTRLGNLYMDAGMFDKAIEFYRGALDVVPADVNVRTDMGACLRQIGKAQEALREFQDSVSRDPSHWKGWFNIGIVYMYDLDDFPKAEAAFAKALELRPGSFDLNAVRSEMEKLRQEKAAKAAGPAPS